MPPEYKLFDPTDNTWKKYTAVVAQNTDSRNSAGCGNFNPGNLMFFPNKYMASLHGVLGPSVNLDRGHPQIVFKTPEDGLRALAFYAKLKYDNGLKTPWQFITTKGRGWTPGSAYAANVLRRSLGIGLHQDMQLGKPDNVAKLMRAIISQEHSTGRGKAVFPDKMVQEAAKAERDNAPGNPNSFAGEPVKAPEPAKQARPATRFAALVKNSTPVKVLPRTAPGFLPKRTPAFQLRANVARQPNQWRNKAYSQPRKNYSKDKRYGAAPYHYKKNWKLTGYSAPNTRPNSSRKSGMTLG